ncbi:hypothetical protein BKA69DRAFT_1055772 [Paraphysoderma sedebokerense]|nr:hypothetical protein BKA69DRAFT_1055772 [Paraphysoderma sedebokerense]
MRKSDVWLAADTIPDMQQWVETLNCLIPKIVEPGLERIEQELYSVHYRNTSLQTIKTELEMENSRLQNILSESNDQALEKEAHMRGLLIRAQQNEEMLRDKVESYESEIQRLSAQNEELSERLKVQSAQLLLSESKEIEAQQYSLHGAIERIQSTIDEHVQSLDKSVDVSNETLGSLRSLETIVSDLVVSFHSKNSESELKTSDLLSDMKQTLACTLESFTKLQTNISESLRSMQTASNETSVSLSQIQSTLTTTVSTKLNNIGDHLDTLTTSHSQLLTFLGELQETTFSSSPRGRTGINIDDNRMSAVQEFMETIDSKLSSILCWPVSKMTLRYFHLKSSKN